MNLAVARDWTYFDGPRLGLVPVAPVQRLRRGRDDMAAKAKGEAIIMERANASSDAARMTQLLLAISERKDRGAFHSLFNYFAPRIQAFLQRQGASADQAEEVVQEAMVTVWRKASQFDPKKASPATWIFTIARNQRIDLLRKANRPEPDMTDPAFEPTPESQGYEVLARKQDAARLKDAITGLPEEQRQVLNLVYFKDKTHDEAAKELEIPLGTVKSRIRLAFLKMRTALGEGS